MKVNIEEVIYEYSVRNKLDEDIPVYSVTNNKGFCTGYFSKDVASKDKSTYKIVPQGYFAYNPSRINVGSVDWQRYKEKVIVSPLYVVFGVLEKINQQYLFHYLKSDIILTYIKEYATGSVRDNLKLSELGKFPINLPPLDEQRHIAAVLDKVSDLIALRKKQLAKLDELVKARFVEMFGDPVLNPKDYDIFTLQRLIEQGTILYHMDGNHGGDYPRNDEFVNSGVPYIGANCIANGAVDFKLAKYLTPERANKMKKGIAVNGDVLFAHNATVGPVVVLRTSENKVILSTSLTAYRCNKSVLVPNYLREYMRSDGFVNQYLLDMQQTTRNQIPITAQKKYFFIVPPLELQQQFADFVDQIDKQEAIVKRSLEKLETLKKSLMQEYFG